MDVQDHKGTSEGSKKSKEGGKEGEEGRRKSGCLECSSEVSVFLIDAAR